MKLHYCLIILFLSSFFASLIQNNFGKTEITLERLDTDNGQYIYYDLYKPDEPSHVYSAENLYN